MSKKKIEQDIFVEKDWSKNLVKNILSKKKAIKKHNEIFCPKHFGPKHVCAKNIWSQKILVEKVPCVRMSCKRARTRYIGSARVYDSCIRIIALIFMKFETQVHKIVTDHHMKFHEPLSFCYGDICKTNVAFV